MRVIIGGVYQPTLDGSSVKITRSASDPVPTCALNLVDNTSSIAIQAMQEILVLDDQVIPNPTVNMLQNPSLNPYTSGWLTSGPPTGETVTQNTGGGVIVTFSNVAAPPNNNYPVQQSTPVGSVVPGQSYTLSFYAQATAPVNIQVNVVLNWYGPSGLQSGSAVTLIVTPTTTLTRYTLSGVAPAGTAYAIAQLGVQVTNTTNSGSITFTQVQLEPMWFPGLSSPTPWCGPGQTNCQQLPLGLWIRQYRKFAGFVTHPVNGAYKGNVRTVQVDAVGYAWLCGTIFCNDSFTNTADSTIMTTLLNKYLKSNGVNMLNTSNVIAGATLANLQSNWDDLRTIFDNLAAQSGFYWTFDYYWNAIYAPPSYYSMPIALIADGSGPPDMVTTFPAYEFTSESDFTQPGSTILVLGSGTNVAEVIDPNVTAQLGIISGYSLPTGTSWMRKVSESTLQSVTDCTNRGMAELLSYDYARSLYHLKANVELIAGQGIRVTSNTDGLNQTALLLQQVTATWLGTGETLTDVWQYQADLGATNRAATNIISRIFRATTRGTAAPAISTTTLAVIEQVGITDQIDANSAYALAVIADWPAAYYRLGEPPGFSITTAYDWSVNGAGGAYNGGFTLGVPGALVNDTNTAVTFNGSSGDMVCPAGATPPAAFSLECWIKIASLPLAGSQSIFANYSGTSGTTAVGAGMGISSSGVPEITIANGSHTFVVVNASAALSTGVWHHLVGTWDGTTTLTFYVDGVSVGSMALTAISASTAALIVGNSPFNDWFMGSVDEAAVYWGALSAARVSVHYNIGRKGH